MAKKRAVQASIATTAAAAPVDAFANGMGRVVSGELNHLVRRLMQQGADGVVPGEDEWPVARLEGESVSAEVVFTPQAQSPHVTLPEDQIDQYRKRMWYLVQSMDDLTADCWDALVGQWVAEARSPDAKVWVTVDQVLAYRGLASFRTGTRGGYTAAQRGAVTEAFLRIMSMRLQLLSVEVVDAQDDNDGAKQIRPVRRHLGGPALDVGMDVSQTDFIGRTEIKALLIRPGEMFAQYYLGAGRPVALLSQKALTYHLYHEIWEKRLTRYFAYNWDRRRQYIFEQPPYTVAELLEAVHQKPNPIRPDEIKKRLEKALRRLTEDGVIAGWNYSEWDESDRPRRGWVQRWFEARIAVEPPEQVKQFYKIALPDVIAGIALARTLPSTITAGQMTGEAVAVIRNHFGLSQEAFAEELGVSRPLINLVENGKRGISKKLQAVLMNWVEQHAAQR